MVAIIRTAWAGTSGGPGVTQLAVNGSVGEMWAPGNTQSAVDAMRAFWDTVKMWIPDEVQLTVLPTIDLYDTATGDLIGSETAATAPVVVQGFGTGVYAGGIGLKMNWNTGQVRNGRRVNGHTYIVPATGDSFSNTGTVATNTRQVFNQAGANLVAAMQTAGTPMMVWSRPRVAPTPRAGYQTEITGGVVGAKSAILRGRRD